MANAMDNFKPAGGVQIKAQLSGPQLSGNISIAKPDGQYVQPVLPKQAQGTQPMLHQQPVQQMPMFGNGAGQQTPKGAQPIALVGSQLGVGTPKLPMSPQAQAPKAPADSQVHLIKVKLEGPDGSAFIGEYELQAPKGSKVLGVTESIIG